MTRLLVIGALVGGLTLAAGAAAEDKEKETGWVKLFNGKDLTGWETHPKNPGKWSVEDGAIVGRGKDTSHLFTKRDDFENFHYRIEAKISDKGNSGQYFRAKFEPGFPNGYEAQINATHDDPIRTGSLYPDYRGKYSAADKEKMIVKKQLHKPDEWFTQEVIAVGNHIIIKVNGEKTVDFVDTHNHFTRGRFAIQQHPPARGSDESVIMVRKVEVRELPTTKTEGK
jgi:hypothetical protein